MIIWLASYPRSGNTLLRIILKTVFERPTYSKHDDANDIGADAEVAVEVGHRFLGDTWPAAYERMKADPEPYLVKTHDAPEDTGKAIYVVRDGRSACRSFFHYLKDFPSMADTFALRDVVSGFTPFGSWGDHLDAWQPLDRPDTLLLKYEDLIGDPLTQIKRLADFTGLKPLHDWRNDFDRLHALNPQFFRAGVKNNAATALEGPDLDLFWTQHDDWMRRLKYPAGPESMPASTAVEFRRYLSDKGREYFNLRERVHLAEKNQPGNPRIESEMAELRAAVARAHQATAVAHEARLTAEARAADATAALEATKNEAVTVRTESEAAQIELAEYKHNIAVQMAHADGRMMENRALFAHQLTMSNEATAQARAELAEAVARAQQEITTAREEVQRHRDRRREMVRRLRDSRRDAAAAVVRGEQAWVEAREVIGKANHRADEATAAAEARAAEATARAEEALKRATEADLKRALFAGQLESAAAARRDLIRRIEESGREAYIAQKQYAVSLQEKNKLLTTLNAAVAELDHRLRVMLTSRFLRAGWALGFGSVPYWDDPHKDELTPLLETVRKWKASDPDSASVLRKLTGLVDRATPDGTDMEAAVGHLLEKGFKPSRILDIGAGKGYWSVMASLRWPDAKYTMIDPLPDSEPELIKTCRDPRFKYLLLAVGNEPGDAVMNLTPERDSSSLLSPPDPDPTHRLTVPVQTLDQLLESGTIDPPQLVKLDVQGFELKALDGGKKLFDTADVFIIESSFFEFMPGCPRIHQLIAYMAERGFYPFDFAGMLRRPFENDLGQVDIVFVRGTHPMVQNIRWVALENAPAATEVPFISPPVPGGSSAEPVVTAPVEHPVEIFHQTPQQTPLDTILGRVPDGTGTENTDPEHADPVPTPPALGDGLVVSVVICTRNPVWSILDRTLDSLEKQTMSRDRFELIIVDNNSTPPLDTARIGRGRSLPFTLVTEPTDGLSYARRTGIAAARGELFVFVDDDNFLAPDYLARAVDIARAEPRIGLFGGISTVELESPIPAWKEPVLPYLGIRDHGPDPITKYADHWGEWEPIGAGMVARREVAEKFVEMFDKSTHAKQLGRRGKALLSGEDSLFARAAHRVGYACSYQPALRLTHFMKSSRLRLKYLARLLEGHGRSYVLLHRTLGKPTEPLKMRTAVARLMYRLKTKGRAGALTWFWDLGYAAEQRNDPPVGTAQPVAVDPLPLPTEGAGHGV